MDCGDYVIVTNARKVKVTGRKDEQILFRKHSLYPGGLKETPYKDMMIKNPDEVLSVAAVRGSIAHYLYRSSDMLSRECFLKTSYVNDD